MTLLHVLLVHLHLLRRLLRHGVVHAVVALQLSAMLLLHHHHHLLLLLMLIHLQLTLLLLISPGRTHVVIEIAPSMRRSRLAAIVLAILVRQAEQIGIRHAARLAVVVVRRQLPPMMPPHNNGGRFRSVQLALAVLDVHMSHRRVGRHGLRHRQRRERLEHTCGVRWTRRRGRGGVLLTLAARCYALHGIVGRAVHGIVGRNLLLLLLLLLLGLRLGRTMLDVMLVLVGS
mmetsp:Transcript_31589/g.76431  ORF Transcript_31589/g.76431 Transcript_31589/m.76431 type:complete len:230 (-) Transcript_31589:962-1651(-)